MLMALRLSWCNSVVIGQFQSVGNVRSFCWVRLWCIVNVQIIVHLEK